MKPLLWLLFSVYAVATSINESYRKAPFISPEDLFEQLKVGSCSQFYREYAFNPFDYAVDKTGLNRYPLQVAIDNKNIDCINRIVNIFKGSKEEFDEILLQADFMNHRAVEHALFNYPDLAHLMLTAAFFKDDDVEQGNIKHWTRFWAEIVMEEHPMVCIKFLTKLKRFFVDEDEFQLIILKAFINSPRCNDSAHLRFFRAYFSGESPFSFLAVFDLDELFKIYKEAISKRCKAVYQLDVMFRLLSEDIMKINELIRFLVHDISDPSILMQFMELFSKSSRKSEIAAEQADFGLMAAASGDSSKSSLSQTISRRIESEYGAMMKDLNENEVDILQMENIYKIIPYFYVTKSHTAEQKNRIIASFSSKGFCKNYYNLNEFFLGGGEQSYRESVKKSFAETKRAFILIIFQSPVLFDSMIDDIRSQICPLDKPKKKPSSEPETDLPSVIGPAVYNTKLVKRLTSILFSEMCRMSAEEKFSILEAIFSEGLGIESVFTEIDWKGTGQVFDLVARKLLPSGLQEGLLLQYFDELTSRDGFEDYSFAFHILELVKSPWRSVPFDRIFVFLNAPLDEGIQYVWSLLQMVNLEAVEVTRTRELFDLITRTLPNRQLSLILYRLRG